jgi:inner membrane protein
MDPLTPMLAGALLALAVEPAQPRPGSVGRLPRVGAGLLAGGFPDIAGLARLWDPFAVLAATRAWSHSLLAMPVSAVAIALLCAGLAKCPAQWQRLLPIIVPALLLHLGLDLVTASGIQPWYPIATTRYAVPLVFAFDPVLLVLAAVAAMVAWRWPSRARWTAIAAFALAAGHATLLGHWRAEALAVGAARVADRTLVGATVHVLPQPLSPRNWLVLVEHGDAYDLAWIRLDRARTVVPGDPAGTPSVPPADTASGAAGPPPPPPRSVLATVRSGYRPPPQAQWSHVFRFGDGGGRDEFARTAWSRPEFAAFRRFSVHTVLSHVEYRADLRQVCAWFHDARFALPGVSPALRFASCQHLDALTWTVQRGPGPLPWL